MARSIKELSDFEKDILKQEIDLVDKTISRIDHIQLTLKNWCIVIWGGSLYLITKDLQQSGLLILLTAIIPVLFGVPDLIWTKQMLIVNYRQENIAAFINGEQADKDFSLLDPIAKKYINEKDFLERTSFSKAVSHKGILFFYLSLILISVVLSIYLVIK